MIDVARQPTVGEPATANAIDGPVVLVRCDVIVFEMFQEVECLLGAGIA